MTSAERRGGEHLSIGEVLTELDDEFPDITISKIRFLESQGLIDPERTPSGYRKFYADDLVRLRWILFQQKAHFLPLKVIKERLEQLDPADLAVLEGPTVAAGDSAVPTEAETGDADLLVSPVEAPVGTRQTRLAPRAGRRRSSAFDPALPLDTPADDARVTAPAPDDEQLYSRATLADTAGIDVSQLGALEQFGLVVAARGAGDDAQFDGEALDTATIAAGFFARGVEARHLRMYRTFADREAVLFGQVLMPYVRQRNPDARARLQGELSELASLGRRLRAALLREAVRDTLSE